MYGHSEISIEYSLFILFPLSAAGQEWSKQDSLRLQQMLESDQEIKINRKLIEKVEQKMYSRKPFVDFDPTLPTLKSSMIFSKPSIRTYQTFLKPGSTFLPTYSCFYFPVFTYFETTLLPNWVGSTSEGRPRCFRVSRFCTPYMLRDHLGDKLYSIWLWI